MVLDFPPYVLIPITFGCPLRSLRKKANNLTLKIGDIRKALSIAQTYTGSFLSKFGGKPIQKDADTNDTMYHNGSTTSMFNPKEGSLRWALAYPH
eukprot:4901664-Amphidinium_carterae.1